MTEPSGEGGDRPLRSPQEMRLRSRRVPVARLSRRVLLGIGSVLALGIAAALFLSLRPRQTTVHSELYQTNSHTPPDGLAALPRDYTGLPKPVLKLGPPLPGDLGGPITNGGAPAPSLIAAATSPNPENQRLLQEDEAARVSRLFVPSSRGGVQDPAAAQALPTVSSEGASAQGPTSIVAAQDHKLAFLNGNVDRQTTTPDRIQPPASPTILQAGSIIPAALITGLRSDLPGQVTAQVTQDVYDSPTGKILLIPQGARLVGLYDAQVSFGQRRALLVWTRLIMPNGRSIVLERQPGVDTQGYAGLEDGIDNHWGLVFNAAVLSTLLSLGSEAGANNNESLLVQAIRQGSGQSFNQVGSQIVSRSLSVQPTITIRPGFPVDVMVTRDLVLEPYRA